jgi:polar amino acid transport system substrate-binding protein
MDLRYPPFEMQDKSGSPDGVSVRMAEALAARSGKRLEIVPMDFSGLIPALRSGKIDLVISSLTATEERRRSVDFSEPYAFTGLALLVARDSSLCGIDDLRSRGGVVAVKAGTTGESWAESSLPGVRRVVLDDPAACVMEVAQGRVDAFLYDQLSILRYAREHSAATRGLLQPFVEETWAVAMAKGNDRLRGEVDSFLRDFRRDGGFAALGERYLAEEKRHLEEAGIPFLLR